MLRPLALALLAGLAIAACAPPQGARTPPTALEASHEPLRSRFDGDAAAPRLLVLASPT